MAVVGVLGDSDLVGCHPTNDRHVSRRRKTTYDPDRAVGRHRSVGWVGVPFGVIEDMGEKTSGRNRGGQARRHFLNLESPGQDVQLWVLFQVDGDVWTGVCCFGRHGWGGRGGYVFVD
jgi:hypothetical protein